MLKPQHCTWYEIKPKDPQWVHLQYFHLTVYRSTIWWTVWDGVGVGWGQWGWTQPKVFIGWADPHRPLTGRPRRWVGGARRGGEGGGMPDGRQGKSYIQVRPTFHQSKTIHSILCKRLRLNARFRSQVWCLARRTQRRQLAKLRARWTPRTGRGHGSGCHLASLSQKCTVPLFCVNTSGLNIGMCFLE